MLQCHSGGTWFSQTALALVPNGATLAQWRACLTIERGTRDQSPLLRKQILSVRVRPPKSQPCNNGAPYRFELPLA